MMDNYLKQAKRILSHDWQPLSELKRYYGFIVWETLVHFDQAEMKIESLGKFRGCRHYFKLKE